ncbi:aldo/keto reductase [Mesobacillus harenae]|uniref:aldo/keto reductase n=1 Tax=Mesobacillus harenae TaxID=2213203 RepID=UPI00158093BE|nr:aldo/keto reductase [Mesobacillus harenae]
MKALEKRNIKSMNSEVTFFGFGSLSIGRDWGISQNRTRPEEEDAGRTLHEVLDLGINLVDTASAYHRSEERIGKFISDRRNEYILATKCGEHNDEPSTYYDFSYKAIKESIDRSLLLLKTDSVDLMQIHFGPDPEKVIRDGETVEAMKNAQKEGKIRFLGASIDGPLATECIESGDFDVMQMEYHLLNQENRQNISLCEQKGIGVLIRTGLGRGLLTSKVTKASQEKISKPEKVKELLELVDGDGSMLTSLALQFLYENSGIHSVLIGTKSTANFKENMKLLERSIDRTLLEKAIQIGAVN